MGERRGSQKESRGVGAAFGRDAGASCLLTIHHCVVDEENIVRNKRPSLLQLVGERTLWENPSPKKWPIRGKQNPICLNCINERPIPRFYPDYYRDAPQFRRVGAGPAYRLEIPRAKLDYTGAYSVIARNCHGEAKAVISLQIYARGQGKEEEMDASSVKHGRVRTLPVVRRGLKDLRCCDGDAVTLECRVAATPQPHVRWEKGGRARKMRYVCYLNNHFQTFI
ncbi:Myosin light chain kinase, smooth muscle [Gryllus bimaculatus]|nr:Myosin light chain kinase, smooth muscle [Gryllus bimaculatus]